MEMRALNEFLDSQEFAAASANSSRIVSKLKSAVERRELYETHQILRTIYFRFINHNDKIPALANLLYHGSRLLSALGEHTSGQDTATLFLEAAANRLKNHRFEKPSSQADLINSSLDHHLSNNTLDLDMITKVSNLACYLPDTEVGQTKFMAEALKTFTPKIVNRELFHHVMARKFWKQKDFFNTRYHFLHCACLENAEDIARLLIEYHSQGANDNEIDLFIAQFTFQFLCLQRPSDSPDVQSQRVSASAAALTTNPITQKTRNTIKSIALKIFTSYTEGHPTLSRKPPPVLSTPLLNFTHFIMSMIDSNQDAPAFKTLCKIYKISTNRDPKYESYLDRIGTLYFGIADPTKAAQGGFFNNILMSLFDGTEDENGEDVPTQAIGSRDDNDLSVHDELD